MCAINIDIDTSCALCFISVTLVDICMLKAGVTYNVMLYYASIVIYYDHSDISTGCFVMICMFMF